MKAYNRMVASFEKLNTPRIKEIGKLETNNFTRSRKMPFEDLALYILSQKGKTITMEINNYFKERNKREDRVTKQNFCKQRCNLNPEVFIASSAKASQRPLGVTRMVSILKTMNFIPLHILLK